MLTQPCSSPCSTRASMDSWLTLGFFPAPPNLNPAVRSNDVTYYLIPVFVLAGLLVLFGLLVFLGRFRKGRYLKPLMLGMMKVPLLRRLLERAQEAALERQNPELMSVKRKLERPAVQMDPAKAQQVLQQLSPGERRAYNDY